MLSSVRTRRHASTGCGLNLVGGHNGQWDAKQHKNTMNFQEKEGTIFCWWCFYFWGVDVETFHFQICFTLNASMQCLLRSEVSSLCPQPPRGPCLKSADLSDKNFSKEFVPEGREWSSIVTGKSFKFSFLEVHKDIDQKSIADQTAFEQQLDFCENVTWLTRGVKWPSKI